MKEAPAGTTKWCLPSSLCWPCCVCTTKWHCLINPMDEKIRNALLICCRCFSILYSPRAQNSLNWSNPASSTHIWLICRWDASASCRHFPFVFLPFSVCYFKVLYFTFITVICEIWLLEERLGELSLNSSSSMFSNLHSSVTAGYSWHNAKILGTPLLNQGRCLLFSCWYCR